MDEQSKINFAKLHHTQSHSPILPRHTQSTTVPIPVLELNQLRSPQINSERGNLNSPLQAQPAVATTFKPTSHPLPELVLIEKDYDPPRYKDTSAIAEPAVSLPNQIRSKLEGEAEDDKEEFQNNAQQQEGQQQRQQQPLVSQELQKQKVAEPATTANTTSQNNNNPTALFSAAGDTRPPTAQAEERIEERVDRDHHRHKEEHEQELRPKLHHLTRHWLAPEDRGTSAIDHLGASSIKGAEQKIRGMSQKELRASFKKVYGTPTSSFNNNWLRRKLYEAVGATGTASTKRYRRVGRNDAAARKRELQRVAAAEAEAEAVEALAEIAAGPSMAGGQTPAESSSK